LTIAADRGHDEVVRLLLQHGANVDHQVSIADISRAVSVGSLLSRNSGGWFFDIAVLSGYRSRVSMNHIYPLCSYRHWMEGVRCTVPAPITTSKWWRRCWYVWVLSCGFNCSVKTFPDGIAYFGCFQ